ncbi:MAG: methylenetetrahydrofolate reductase [Oscillospiraceae bacterium]|nr:methylenetetrahydrofolate reductase [Oscillospiraceae bacterium]MCL2279053.1 methylenetetrahydrofolate reductase [Oscillospiraceae bacterium]
MKLKERLHSGEFVVTAEVGPPKGISLFEVLESAKAFLGDTAAINVTDCQASVMRLGSLATCKALLDSGHEPIFQMACRDRNRIALQSDLLSAAYFGIENVLLLTGDYTTLGDSPDAKPVYDLDSVSLLHAACELERGVDLNANALSGSAPKFFKGAVVSPCSDSPDVQLHKMDRKITAGAEFFQTQAIFEPEKFIAFMDKASRFNVPVLLGVVILKSAGMARFMNRNIAGVSIPEWIIDKLDADKERAKSGETGLEIAASIISKCRNHCAGLHIMSLGWEDKVPSLLERMGNYK